MQKTITVASAEQASDALLLYTEQTDVQAKELRPRRHVLVDSDRFAFLYILETKTDFIYISIPHEIWPELKVALEEEKTVYAQAGDARIELEQLQEELAYLIENIEGNANYGEELVSRVEAIFLS